MKFFKHQQVTCLSHVPEDMSTMQNLVASMIHHAADLFKVCTCVIKGKAHRTSTTFSLFGENMSSSSRFVHYCISQC